MTAAQLLAWIAAAIGLQIVAAVGATLWRRRRPTVEGVAAHGDSLPAALPRSDAAWAGARPFRVKARAFEDEAASICSFILEPVDGVALPDFRPGQFLTFALSMADGGSSGDTRTVIRCYSLSDRPSPSHYRVSIKRVPAPADRPDLPPGLSSSHFHDRVQPGDVMMVRAPAGHFFIDPDPTAPAVLVAGGIGITPMMGMLEWCVATQPQRKLHLFYGVRNGRDHAFKARLEALAGEHPQLRLHTVYSRPSVGDREGLDFQHVGHVDIALLQRSLPHGRHQFYLCGPTAMLASLVPALEAWGVPDHDIHFEAFGPASVKRAAPAAPTAGVAAERQVRFERSGRTLAWDGRDANLLDFAERHGVVVDSGCRSGGCGSCETRLLSGSVVYERRPDHDVAPGHCLLCVGAPASAVVLEA